MMDSTTFLIYLGCIGMAGLFGVLILDIVDRKSDEMAGFRQPRIKIRKKYNR